jgi:hypothetical protein
MTNERVPRISMHMRGFSECGVPKIIAYPMRIERERVSSKATRMGHSVIDKGIISKTCFVA